MKEFNAAKSEWLAETAPEAVEFELFKKLGPKILRRHMYIADALADIEFDYEPGAVWLNMILSERAGQGRLLMDRIKQLGTDHGFRIAGQAVPMKPSNWNSRRAWSYDESILLDWYRLQGFRIVDQSSNLVVYP